MTTDELVRRLEAERAQPIPAPDPKLDPPQQVAQRLLILRRDYPRAGS